MTSPVRKFLFGTTLRLVTPLDQASCVARLKKITGSSWFGFFSSKPLRGSVSDREFHWRKPTFFSNGFQTHLTGMLTQEPSGTGITCRFGLSLSTRISLGIFFLWCIGAPFVELLAPGFISIKLDDVELSDETPRLLMAMLFLPLLGLFFLFGRFLARNDQDFMLNLLKEKLQAQEVATIAPQRAQGPALPRRPSSVIER